MKRTSILAAAAAALIGAAQAVERPWNWGDESEWRDAEFARSQALCRAVRTREPPAAHRPQARSGPRLEAAIRRRFITASAGPPIRWRAPLRVRRGGGRADRRRLAVRGPAMLMTIYANGAGVPRDLDLAIRYACEISSAPAESHGRVMHLEELKGQAAPGEFHYCDDITSGSGGGQCAAFGQQWRDRERAAELRALTAGWSAAERSALARLAGAFSAFEEAHVQGEVDMSGTLRAAFVVAAGGPAARPASRHAPAPRPGTGASLRRRPAEDRGRPAEPRPIAR